MKKGIENTRLFLSIKQLIEQGKQQIAISVNTTMSMLYWQIGKMINDDVLQNQRAEYGKQIVSTLSRHLTQEYGNGWGEKHLRQCMQFAQAFPDEQIVYTLCRELNWSHLRLVMFMDDPLKVEIAQQKLI